MKYTKFYSTVALLLMCVFSYGQSDTNLYKLDSFLTLLESNDRLMGTVTIAQNGEVVYEWAGGTAWHHGLEVRDNDPSSIMSIGSASKMLTAVMVFQLVEEGILDLDETLDTYFPEIDGSDKISLRHLLQHQSGLYNFTSDPEMVYMIHRNLSRTEMLDIFCNYSPEAEPGTISSYSNTNYILLSYILEDVSGLNFNELLHNNINEVVKLQNTFFSKENVPAGQLTNSFIKTIDDWVTMLPEIQLNTTMGAGGIVSNGNDMVSFMDALFHGDLIAKESLAEMLSIENGYGLGLLETPFAGTMGYGHYGNIDEYYTFISHFPAQNKTISVLLNGLDYCFQNTLNSILGIVFNDNTNWPDFTRSATGENDLRALAGKFINSEKGLEFVISVEHGKLTVNMGTNKTDYVRPLKNLSFRSDQSGLEFSFQMSREGEANSLRIESGNEVFILERIKETGI